MVQETTAVVVVLSVQTELGSRFFATDLHGMGAACAVAAADGWMKEIWWAAEDRLQLMQAALCVAWHGTT